MIKEGTTKRYNKDLQNSAKCSICDNDYVVSDIKERDHCHITRKYRGSAHRDCNIKGKLNHKISFAFHNLKNYDSHLTIQELGQFDFKINVISNGLEKCTSFHINIMLIFVDSFQFLSLSLDSLVKYDFKYLSHEFDNKVLDLVKQKGFYPYEYMSGFEKFKEELQSKEKFYSSFTGEKLVLKSMSMFLSFGIDLK